MTGITWLWPFTLYAQWFAPEEKTLFIFKIVCRGSETHDTLSSENSEVKYTHARSWWPPAKAVQSVRKPNVTAVRGDRKTSQTKKRDSRAHMLPSSCDTTCCNYNWIRRFRNWRVLYSRVVLSHATTLRKSDIDIGSRGKLKLVQWHNFKRKFLVLGNI